MMAGTESEKKLLSLIEEGVSASADSLAEVSHTTWATQTLSISMDGSGSVESLQGQLALDKTEHYGAFLSTSGMVFLLMLPKKGGPGLAEAFMSDRSRRAGSAPPPEGTCIAEIANVVINTIANTLANACDDIFMLSAPTMILGKKEALLKLAVDELEAGGQTFAIMTYVSMSSEKLSSDCTVLLLLSPACRGRILKALDQ
ncbi:MAG: hypothetical protein ACHQ2Z_11885 [Elusimicrobiota bacterium]